jgi:hypothetical protein
MKIIFRSFFTLLVLAILAGCCIPIEPPPGESPLSPLPESPLSLSTSQRFNINKPIRAGAKEVSGQGPIGIPLQVVDITAGGQVLGTGTIDKNGNFSIKLNTPIEANRSIGIQLATAKDPDTWLDLWALRGEGAKVVPQIGEFFDSTVSIE